MDTDKQIWNLSKSRFLQAEARLWVLGNRSLEILLLISLAVSVYFEFFSSGAYSYIKYLGLVGLILSFITMRSRQSQYHGYFDGYEQGFKDAATRSLDYWGETHSELSDDAAIDSILSDIRENEGKISTENTVSRDKQMEEGFSKLIGFFLTWHKLTK